MQSLFPTDEERRLTALHALALQGIKAGDSFNSLVSLAAEMLGCPVAALTLVGRDRQWITASVGSVPADMAREDSFCTHTIAGHDVLAVPDLSKDARFESNRLVTEGGARFYAGTPIHAPDENGELQRIGALCVIDTTPRSLSRSGQQALEHLGRLADALIGARHTALRAVEYAQLGQRQAVRLERHARTFSQAERMAAIGSWRLTLADEKVEWSDGIFRIYGLPIGPTPPIATALEQYPPADQARLSAALALCMETGAPFDLELDFTDAQGRMRRVRAAGERELVDGVPVALIGMFQDITERHQLESALRRSADTDALTGLCNRAAFEKQLGAAMERAHGDGIPLLLALIDLDGFKAINDTLGHLAGDDVLRGVGRRLTAPWLLGSTAARLGGDEFAVIVDHPDLVADPDALVGRLEEELCQTAVGPDGLALAAAGTVGARMLEPEMHALRDFVHATDVILYAAKRRRVGERRRGDRRAA